MKKCVEKIITALKNHRESEYNGFKKKMDDYKQMTPDQLSFKYINLKSKYEYKKGILTFFLILIGLPLIMNIWKQFLSFMEKLLQYITITSADGTEIVQISFYLSVIITICITTFILFFLFTFLKELTVINKELLIIEEIRNQSKHFAE